jgi:predicted alpha/beta-hydrolase family hydrolase
VTAVATPHGPGELLVHEPTGVGERRGTLLLSHGAGRGTDTADLTALAQALPAHGIAVALFDQPWRVAGRRIAGPPATLDEGLRAAAAHLTGRPAPLVVGGRSAGARSACRCATGLGAAGVLALAFPLHPPGRPERSRADELTGAGVPTLVLQGERDPMGRPEEFPVGPPGAPSGQAAGQAAGQASGQAAGQAAGQAPGQPAWEVVVVPGADHGLTVARSSALGAAGVADLLVSATLAWWARRFGNR